MINKEKYMIGILFSIIIVSLIFDNYKTIEELSNTTTSNYKLTTCDNTTYLPSPLFYFKKMDNNPINNFNPIYIFSDKNSSSKIYITNNIFNSNRVFNIDECNNVLYSIFNNKLIKYNATRYIIKMEKIIETESSGKDIADCIIQFMKDSKIEYILNSSNKTITFTMNNQVVKIIMDGIINVEFNINNLEKNNIINISYNNNNIFTKNATTNKKYIYGKITYDDDPNHFINCICINYYQ